MLELVNEGQVECYRCEFVSLKSLEYWLLEAGVILVVCCEGDCSEWGWILLGMED